MVSRFLNGAGLWLAQLLLLVCILLLLAWVRIPAVVLLAMALLAFTLLGAPLFSRKRSALPNAWGCSVLAWVGLLVGTNVWDSYFAAMAGLTLLAVLLTAARMVDPAARHRWKILALAWACFSSIVWLGGGYAHNERAIFYLGLVSFLGFLILTRAWLRLKAWETQAVNTLILTLVILPVVNGVWESHATPLDTRPETGRHYYSYDEAKGDPVAFGRWHEFLMNQYYLLEKDIFEKIPNASPPLQVRSGSHSKFFESAISINSRGFRGAEIPVQKNHAYRIVALGESTTFGMTLQGSDKPWPELLEAMINQRIKPQREVEVINAGVPGYTILDNLGRISRKILPLAPDMIISYHGINGFFLLNNKLARPVGTPAPVYRMRPLKIAGDVEHRVRMLLYERREAAKMAAARPLPDDPMKSGYADAYRQLIQLAETNKIRLALADYSMAVNKTSPAGVMDFYRGTSAGQMYAQADANAIHTTIVQKLAEQHPQVIFVETHPRLDGDYRKFIDSVHLTQEGRKQLAENIFAGIRSALEKDLAAPSGVDH